MVGAGHGAAAHDHRFVGMPHNPRHNQRQCRCCRGQGKCQVSFEEVDIQLQRMLLTVVAMTVVCLGVGCSTASATASELVGALTQKLGVTEQQATGGAGAMFGLAQSKLSPDNFRQVARVVPGMEGLLQAAPTGACA